MPLVSDRWVSGQCDEFVEEGYIHEDTGEVSIPGARCYVRRCTRLTDGATVMYVPDYGRNGEFKRFVGNGVHCRRMQNGTWQTFGGTFTTLGEALFSGFAK